MQPSSLTARSTGRRLGLGAKLGAGFAALTLLSVLLGLFAINRMSAVDAASSEIGTNYLPSTLDAARLALALDDAQRLQLHYVFAGPADANEDLAKLQAGINRVNAARQEYDPLIDAGEERQRYSSVFDPIWKAFQADVLDPTQLRDAKHDASALAVYTGKLQTDFSSLMEFMKWDLGYDQKNGLAAAAKSRALFVST
jgi:methyl-accepting chemotaxis protein